LSYKFVKRFTLYSPVKFSKYLTEFISEASIETLRQLTNIYGQSWGEKIALHRIL